MSRKLTVLILIMIFLTIFVRLEIRGRINPSISRRITRSLIYAKRTLNFEVPSDARTMADEYIINILGDENFQKHIKYLPGESYRDDYLEGVAYMLTYEFKPYKRYGNLHIKISVVNNELKHKSANWLNLPRCSFDPKLCEFNLSAKEFRQMYKNYYLNGISMIDPPYIFGYSCRGESSFVRINYITKEVEVTPAGIEGNGIQLNPCWVL